MHMYSGGALFVNMASGHIDCVFQALLKPGAQPRVGNPEVTGIPQVDSTTRQRQLISKHAEVIYLTKPPITTKPVVRTN